MFLVTYLLQLILELIFRIYFAIHKNSNPSPNLVKAVELYQHDGFGGTFAKIRAWDAPYELVEKMIPKNATVLDLGSGDGLLSNFIAISSKRRKVVGIELNPKRANKADKGLPNVVFKSGSILTEELSFPKVTLLAHVLHHLPSFKDQEKLLKKILVGMKKGQQLIILEIDKKPAYKYVFSWITDAITVPILFDQKLFTTKFYYRNLSDWERMLRDSNVTISGKKVDKGMPFSHILISVVKK